MRYAITAFATAAVLAIAPVGLFVGYQAGVANTKTSLTPVAPADVDKFAQAFCKLDSSALLAQTATDAQNDFKAFISKVKPTWNCSRVKFLRAVNFNDGSTDYIYLLQVDGQDNWIVFHFDPTDKFFDLSY